MSTPKNCIYCSATNRIIDFVADGSDGKAKLQRLSLEFGAALVVLPVDDTFVNRRVIGAMCH